MFNKFKSKKQGRVTDLVDNLVREIGTWMTVCFGFTSLSNTPGELELSTPESETKFIITIREVEK